MKICFGAYVGLFIMQTIKQSIKNTPEVRTVDTAMTHTFFLHARTHAFTHHHAFAPLTDSA